MAVNVRLKDAFQRYARANKIKYSQAVKRIARKIGIGHRYIYAIIRGDRDGSPNTQYLIAAALGESAEALFAPLVGTIGAHDEQTATREPGSAA